MVAGPEVRPQNLAKNPDRELVPTTAAGEIDGIDVSERIAQYRSVRLERLCPMEMNSTLGVGPKECPSPPKAARRISCAPYNRLWTINCE